LNWDDLRIFLAVARNGTLAQAAARLNIDATTVARRIKRLEATLSSTLFEHTPTGHILTTRGTLLVEQAQSMEDATIAATEMAGNISDGTAGVVRVSVSEGFGTGIIARNLYTFTRSYPNVAIELVTSSGFLSPSRREADIAIMLARPNGGPLVVRKLTNYHLGLYGNASISNVNDMSEMSNHPIVGYVPDLIYAPELRYLDQIAGNPVATLTSTSVNAQAQMVRHGAGIGILPCFIGDMDHELRRLLPGSIDIRRSFWLVVHRDMRSVARVRHFMDWLTALVTNLQPLLEGHAIGR
jgi:DNA-binding transcriptional LysR family regulator